MDVQALEAAKAASVAQLLFKAARLVNDRALALVRQQTGLALRPAHTNLFPHIDLEGTRLTVLAKRVGISKQAVGQLVDELVAMGGLERVPDPTDRRAKLIRFPVVDGEHGIVSGLRVLGMLEADLAAQVGPEAWAGLAEGLRAVLSVVEGADPSIRPSPSGLLDPSSAS